MSSKKLPEKRKRNVLSINKKLEIIQRLKSGESVSKLANEYNLGKSTVSDLKRDANKLEAHCSKLESTDGSQSRKTMKLASDDKLDLAVYQWFVQKRSQGIPISGPMIIAKALTLNEKLKGEKMFKASSGWLKNFRTRHGIRQLGIEGEKLSANSESAKEFLGQFKALVDRLNLSPEQVYNCDETGLYWKALPSKTLAARSEHSAPGHKVSKDRITILTCSNASGSHKLPVAVIGKASKPRAFKNLNLNNLPVSYYAHKKAWMNREIFSTWFFKIFVPQVKEYLTKKRLEVKALLIMDNAPSHPSTENLYTDDGSIKCIFLPPNTTSILQPMDQGVIETLKRMYRKELLRKLVLADAEDEMTIIQFWKVINMKDAIFMIAQAWDDLSPETLKRSWRKLWPESFQENNECINVEIENNEEFLNLAKEIPGFEDCDRNDMVEWLDQDCKDQGYHMMDDDEIVDAVITGEMPESEVDISTDKDEPSVSNSEAVESFTKCIAWMEQQEEVESTQILLLRRMLDLASRKRFSKLKQLKLSAFF